MSRLRGQAHVCHWTKSGSCSTTGCAGSAGVDYTDDIVKLILLNGLADDDIRKEVLGTADIDSKSLNDTVALTEGKETAARAMSTDGHRAAATAYKQANRTPRPTTSGPATSTTETEGPARNIRCACGRMTPKFG